MKYIICGLMGLTFYYVIADLFSAVMSCTNKEEDCQDCKNKACKCFDEDY